MTTPEVLNQLIEKVEQGSGPDRDIDAEIWWLFPQHEKMLANFTLADDARRKEIGVGAFLDEYQMRHKGGALWRHCSSGSHADWAFGVSPITGSRDAAESFGDRVFAEDASATLVTRRGPTYCSAVYTSPRRSMSAGDFHHSHIIERADPDDLPRAIVSATLRARLAKMEDK